MKQHENSMETHYVFDGKHRLKHIIHEWRSDRYQRKMASQVQKTQ
jgi:hypothetical protein